MDWIEEAERAYGEYHTWEREKKYKLLLQSPEDIPEDCSEIKAVSIHARFPAQRVIPALKLLRIMAPQLETISVLGQNLSWNDAFSLELEGIKKLTFSLDGAPGDARIESSTLKELIIFASPTLTPLELLASDPIHLDFSGVPALETLKLLHFQQVSPEDFSELKYLRELAITEADIRDLRWLRSAAYQLRALHLDGSLCDCSDIVYQPQIETLVLTHSYITDISPVEQLNDLQYLDLRWNDIHDEGKLRSKGIQTVLLTTEDGDRQGINRSVRDLVRMAIRRIASDDKTALELEKVPELRRKWLLRRVNQPFADRLMQAIKVAFLDELSRIQKAQYHCYRSFTNEEGAAIFANEAYAFYPFLQQE